MGQCNSSDIFQEKMNELFNGLKYVRTYIDDLLIICNLYVRTCIDDLLIISHKSFEDHINKLDKVLSKLNQKGFKVNAEKSFFARNKVKYLGFRITRQCIMPLLDKVEVIETIEVPTTKKQLRSFIELINYY